MNQNPEVSVIVANYNHAQYIEQAVKSILGQTLENWEMIIIDDASTDGSQDMISELEKLDKQRIRAIYQKENKGKWSVLNAAIAEAKSPLITLQDADDACTVDRLLRQQSVLKQQGSYHNLCGFTHCYTQEEMDAAAVQTIAADSPAVVMDHDTVTKLVHAGYKQPGINHYFVGNDYEVHGASSMFYKQLWTHGMKFLPGNMNLRCQKAEDSDHNTKMTLLLQKTSVLREPLYCYRRNTSTNDAYREGL